ALTDFSRVELLPEVVRNPGKIELSLQRTVGAGDGEAAVSVETGAAVRTDAKGSVGLVSDTSIFVKGGIEAPAGTLSLRVTPPAGSDAGFLADQGIWIGPGASLSAKGQALTVSDPLGRITGDVLSGGTISLHADRGFVNVLQGARIDASGTAAPVDVPSGQHLGAGVLERRSIPSDGGAIDLRAAEGMRLLGDLTALPGPGAGAAGGTLSISLNKLTRNEPDPVAPGQQPFPENPSVIRVTGAEVQAAGSEVGVGSPTPAAEFGLASLRQAMVEQGGFASVSLVSPDRIEFQGAVSLATARSITLDAPTIAARSAPGTSAKVAIETGYLALGSTQTRPGGLAPTTGPVSLSAHARLIDLVGASVLSGFNRADLFSSGDLRVTGVRTTQDQRDFTGGFHMAGDLSLGADQIYPTTLSDFRIAVENTPTGTLTVLPGHGPSKVMSAGGKLTLEAPNIVQGGVVKAPLGQLTLTAADSLTLAPGSRTSNAGDGLLVPFGRTQGGLDWIYPLGTQNLVYSVGLEDDSLPPPQKALSLSAKSVTVAAGAVADSSGGGDLFAFEFIPGPGGSRDVLEGGDSQGKYAVLPGFKGDFAPYDPLESPASGLRVGDTVHLAGGGGLKAGDYVLLPAHYALLPGAYLLSEEPGTRDFLPGSQLRNGQGDFLVAGYRKVAGSDLYAARWSGFAVTQRSVVRTRAEYDVSRGNDFFSAQAARKKVDAPMLPRDAGAMRVSADTALTLAGTVRAEAGKQGNGGLIDIEVRRLAVVSAKGGGGATPGTVELSDAELDRLQVPSILIGGVRETGESGILLKTRAESLTVGKDVDLRGPEVMLTAQDALTVGEGARISGSGKRKEDIAGQALHLEADGALLRVSSGAPVEVRRSATSSGAKGALSVGAGAILAADGSMNLDASGEVELRGSLAMKGGSLSLGAHHIGLGDASTGNAGLLLGSAQLESLALDELRLSSPNAIGVYGAPDMKLGRLEWRSPGVDGFGAAGQNARIDADSLLLTNPGGLPSSAPATGVGNIEFSARRIELGEGNYRLSGFSRVSFRATERVLGTGEGVLHSTADLSFTAPVWSSAPAADTVIEAVGHTVSVARTASGAGTGELQALGGRLAIEAASIDFGGNILLPSGQVALTARSGDLDLATGSLIDVSGRKVGSGAAEILTDGGRIALSADGGSVLFDRSARLDLRGQRGGVLQVAAANGRFEFAGDADAHGTSVPGSFSLDEAGAGDGTTWPGLLSKLESSGFGDSISVRIRQGDLELGSKEHIDGRDIRLTADTGSLRVQGSLTARGAGAQVNLEAGDELQLAPTARIQAKGMEGQAGSVRLDAADGDGDGVGGIALSAGAGIDVGPADTTTGAGSVQLAAQRKGGDVAVTGDLRGAVVGTDDITVEAVRTYRHTGAITTDDIQGWEADTLAYMEQAEAIERRLGTPGGLCPGITVKSDGDLNLDTGGWDLSGQRYGGRPGVLALEAAGDLTFNGKLSDGFRAYDAAGIDLSALLGAGQAMPVKDMLLPGS
ncbi:MAG: hemagglutinin-related protein, partial [Proteobacteria bacterium]|nr:hemagglutinin-related protein [Pseudomonadota bacterium]